MPNDKEGELACVTGQPPDQSQPAVLGEQDQAPDQAMVQKPRLVGDEGDGWRTSQFQGHWMQM